MRTLNMKTPSFKPHRLSLLLSVVLVGCASGPQRPNSLLQLAATPAAAATVPAGASATATEAAVPTDSTGTTAGSNASPTAAPDSTRRQRIYPGNDQTVNLAPRPPTSVGGQKISLNFDRAPLSDVVQSIVGDILKKPYSLSGDLPGDVTLRTTSPVAQADVGAILEALLSARGLGMVTDAQGTVHIGPNDALKGIPSRPGQTIGRGLSVVPLQHIGAREMADILKPLMAPDALVRVDTLRNLLVVQGTQTQIQSWLDLVHTFDVNALAGMSFGIFALENAEVNEIAKALELLAARGDSPIEGGMRVLPVERLNSLLVIAPRKQMLDTVKTWIDRLDQAPDSALQPQVHVYAVQHGSATQMANVLGALFGSKTAATNNNARGALAPGLGGASASSTRATTPAAGTTASGASGTAGTTAAAGTANRSGTSTGATGSTGLSPATSLGASSQATLAAAATSQQASAIDLEGDVRIVADDTTNSLLVHASRRAYRRIESAIRQMDIAPSQVLIEASIIEVSLTDKLQYGLQWYFNDSLGGRLSGSTGTGSLSRGTTSALSRVLPGFNYTITDAAGSVRAVLSALASETGLKVVSSPSLLALDRQAAEIRVGNQQPILSSTTTTDGGNVTQAVTYKDTGVLLRVVPRINSNGLVTLDIAQEVTDVGAIDEATRQRSFLQRSLQSRIAIPSGQTAVLGGLIRDNSSNSQSGLPGLSKIPGIGALFGATEKSIDRTELLVVLTPRVLENARQLTDISDEIRARLLSNPPLSAPGLLSGRNSEVPTEAPEPRLK
ncbi:type II secretion system secretin GspD [Hydrogenophaga defluvii]|uniref:Type II secretion system secretin GspD n=2 Tax=Hydrogenophaga defluvii TaxID=249410 RepID=A0ABW2S8L7_9BURK